MKKQTNNKKRKAKLAQGRHQSGGHKKGKYSSKGGPKAGGSGYSPKKAKKKVSSAGLIRGEVRKISSGAAFVVPMSDISSATKMGAAFAEARGDGIPDKDIFISQMDLKGAITGDIVLVDMIPEIFWKGGPEGIVVSIEDRLFKEVYGILEKNQKGYGFVTPLDRRIKEDIFIRGQDIRGAKHGDVVVVQIKENAKDGEHMTGTITKVIAKANEKGGDITGILLQKDIRDTFPSRAMAEAAFYKKQGITGEDMKGRRDLRGETIFTIDGADSKDFDDAVSCTILDNGNYYLGVHIADVSHYVKNDDPLDKEALKRGNSIYLPDRVVPMLPFELSDDLCSLNPGVDRLTLSCSMEINSKGEVVDYDIYESVIRSCERLVYDDISDIIEYGDETQMERYQHILKDIFVMNDLAGVLMKAKDDRGNVDFDLDEAKITMNDYGEVTDITLRERRIANRIIEEFMLKANETVAKAFYDKKVPFIYRVHKKPEMADIEVLATFLAGFGIVLHGSYDNISPQELARVIDGVKGTESERAISTVVLRSMTKAYYDTECLGHFGLALSFYTHFTSPIRRYSDLFIHRVIKHMLHGEIAEAKLLTGKAQIASWEASAREREAIDIERDVEKLKMCQYMEGFIDEEFEGHISGVTEYGLFVELPNTIEGRVAYEDMEDDFYTYHEGTYSVTGQDFGKTYTMGDPVRVRLVYASAKKRQIDFKII